MFTLGAENPVVSVKPEETVKLETANVPTVACVILMPLAVTLVTLMLPIVAAVMTAEDCVTRVNDASRAFIVPVVTVVAETVPAEIDAENNELAVACVNKMLLAVTCATWSDPIEPVPADKLAVEAVVNEAVVPVSVVNDAAVATTDPKVAVVAVRLPAVSPVMAAFDDEKEVTKTVANVASVAAKVPAVRLVAANVPAEIVVATNVDPDAVVKDPVVKDAVVATKLLTVAEVATKVPADTVLELRLVAETLVATAFVTLSEDAVAEPEMFKVAVVKPVAITKFVLVTFVNTAPAMVLAVPAKLPADNVEVATSEPTVKLDILKLAVERFVTSALVITAPAAVNPVDITLVKLPVPATSSANCGLVVLIPTFPPVKKILPIVLLFPETDKLDPTNIDPTDIFVSTKLVVVMFVIVSVPDTVKLPDKLKLPPVMAVETKLVIVAVVNVPVVARIVPAVMPVANKLAVVTKPADKFAVDTLVVAIKFAELNVPDTLTLAVVRLVITALVTVAFAAATLADDTLVVASNVPVVKPVVNTKLDTVKLPAKLTLPSVTVMYAGDAKIVDRAAGSAICDVIIDPAYDTTTNLDNSGLQAIVVHSLSAALARVVQFSPFELVITRFPVPVSETTTKSDNSGLQAIAFH